MTGQHEADDSAQLGPLRQPEWFHLVLDQAGDAYFLVDETGRIIDVNERACSSLGYTRQELLQLTVPDIDPMYPPERFASAWRQLTSNPDLKIEGVHRRKDGSTFPVEVSARSIHLGDTTYAISLVRDLTERKRLDQLQEELAHALRLSTMGEMTAAIAHELNQPLTAIVNYGGACLKSLSRTDTTARQYVRRIEEQAHRAGSIIQRLRGFAERHRRHRSTVDVNALINEAAQLLDAEANHRDVRLHVDLAEGPPRVLVDRIQIQQVVINLCRNAFDAVASVQPERRRVCLSTDVVSPDRVRVIVQDNGRGLGDADPERLFDPFYTTKASGMGFGLAISQRIVRDHDGDISFRENPDAGLTFTFDLPVAGEADRLRG